MALGVLLFALPAVARAERSSGAREELAASAVHRGLLAQGEATVADDGDLDGDGRPEVVAGYRIEAGGRVFGVLVVYGGFEGVYRDRALIAWPGVWPVALTLRSGALDVTLRTGHGVTEQRGAETLVWGKDLDDQRSASGALEGVEVWASSTLRARRAHTRVEALVDGALATGWAEGAVGTGISERVRLSFATPFDLALVGIAGGNGASEEARQLSNRLGRVELRVLTSSEVGDPAAGIDYAAMGLEFAGHKERVDLPDRPGIVFLGVGIEEVLHLEIKVESVYLGDRYDDLWIAEVVPVRLRPVPALELVDRPATKKAPPTSPQLRPKGDQGASSPARQTFTPRMPPS